MTVDFNGLVGFDVLQGTNYNTELFEPYYIEVQVKNGYTLKTVPTLTVTSSSSGDNDFQLILKSGTTDTYYYDYDNMINNITSVTVSGLAENEQPQPQPSSIAVDFSALIGFDVVQGDTFDTTQFTDYELKVKVKDGYVVTTIPTLHIFRESQIESDDYQLVLISGTNDTYYYSLENLYSDVVSVSVDGDAVSDIQSLYTEYPLITCYKVDSDKMQGVANLRFQNENNEKVDLGKYIISLVRYPFEVSILNNANIKIGYFQTSINADLIEKQIETLTLGKILVSGLEQNSSDIAQTIIELHLPFIGIYQIESKYINTEIEVHYRIDVVSNNCVIDVFSDLNLILQIESKIGFELPYILKETMYESNLHGKYNDNILKAMQPKAIIRQKAKVSGFHYITSIEVDNLNNINGFIKSVDYDIENIPTDTETNMIKALMNNGVFI